jgi:hypothetical protein
LDPSLVNDEFIFKKHLAHEIAAVYGLEHSDNNILGKIAAGIRLTPEEQKALKLIHQKINRIIADNRCAVSVDKSSGRREEDLMEVDQKIAELFEKVRDACLKETIQRDDDVVRQITGQVSDGLKSIHELMPALTKEVESLTFSVSNYKLSNVKQKAVRVSANITDIIIFFDRHAVNISNLPKEVRESVGQLVSSLRLLSDKFESVGMGRESIVGNQGLIKKLKSVSRNEEKDIIKEWLKFWMNDLPFDKGQQITRLFMHSSSKRRELIVSLLMDLAFEDCINRCAPVCPRHYDYVDMIVRLHLSEDLSESVELILNIWAEKIRSDRYSDETKEVLRSAEQGMEIIRRELEIYLLASIIVSDRGLEAQYPEVKVIEMLARENAKAPFVGRLNVNHHYARNLYKKIDGDRKSVV